MTAMLTRHEQRRNVLVFPTDFYRKHTESSSSDSNSIPNLMHNNNTNKYLHSLKLQSLQGKGKTRPNTRQHPYQPQLQQLLFQQPSERFPRTRQGHADATHAAFGQKYPAQSRTTNALTNTIRPLDINLLTPTSAAPETFSSPSFPSSSSSTTSTTSHLHFDTHATSKASTISTNTSATMPNINTKVVIRIPTLAAFTKKRKATSDLTTAESSAVSELSGAAPSPNQKRLKIRLKLRSLPKEQPVAKPEFKPEPIVISDDSDDDLTSTESILSQDDETDVDEESSNYASSSSGRAKLDHQLRHVLNTIFPKRDDKNRATLKSAFELCSQLRDDYIVGRLLGSGSSGFVLSAKRVFDGREVAIKVIPSDNKYTESKFRRELDILNALTHENILGFVEYFESPDCKFLVTEMGGSSLFDFIEMHKSPQGAAIKSGHFGSGIQESVIRSIFMQLSLALYALHQNRIVHGDIKDENALITVDHNTNTYRARICDFGHSKRIKEGSLPSFTFYGTTILAPPEMDANNALREKMKRSDIQVEHDDWTRYYGYEADVFAMGLMLYTLVHGDLPSELMERDSKLSAAYKRRRRSVKTFPFSVLQKNLDEDLKDLLKRMLAVTPSRRITMAEVINHPWLTKS
ncbi:protein kinase, AMP-activated, alpha 2 catalytic subunit [Linnemannia hyalina]|uniref:Protein kinase, AMP-activated, alpha 2 catalytic subunit n=1 Tax=Linnemannia hyalina TaxID=64524 RepID=A0A9P7XLW4_9FUNG|nr:protein kinase, AMP-activated, alpha 2 catalytic subunit [Linnemannia hyalina]